MPEGDAPLAGNHDGGAAQESQGDAPEVFLETGRSQWRTREAAAEGVKSLEAELLKSKQELSDLREGRESASAQKELLEKLVQNTSPQGETDTQREARFEKLREEAAENPGMLVDFVRDLTVQGEQSFVGRLTPLEEQIAELKSVRDEVQALKDSIGAVQLSQNPTYQRYKDEIDEVKGIGVDEETAIKIVAARHKDDGPEIETSRIPGSMSSGRMVGGQGAVVPEDVMATWKNDAITAGHAEGGVHYNALIERWTDAYRNKQGAA